MIRRASSRCAAAHPSTISWASGPNPPRRTPRPRRASTLDSQIVATTNTCAMAPFGHCSTRCDHGRANGQLHPRHTAEERDQARRGDCAARAAAPQRSSPGALAGRGPGLHGHAPQADQRATAALCRNHAIRRRRGGRACTFERQPTRPGALSRLPRREERGDHTPSPRGSDPTETREWSWNDEACGDERRPLGVDTRRPVYRSSKRLPSGGSSQHHVFRSYGNESVWPIRWVMRGNAVGSPAVAAV
jgi:hypothetical protein